MMIQTKLITVTPDLAAKWLEANTDNRPIRQKHVEYFVGAIDRGEWITTHQGIAFDATGRLIDGQHRLWAIFNAGKAVQMLVTTGLDENAYAATDLGLGRSVADVLKTDKMPTEVANWLASRLMYAGGANHLKATPAQVAKYIDAFGPTVIGLHEFCGKKKAKVFSSSPSMAIAAARALTDGEEYVFESMRILVHNEFQRMSPALASVYRQVIDGKIKATSGYDLACRMWIALDRKKQTLSKIQVTDMDDSLRQIRQAVSQVMVKQGAPE
jgi:hypothetical protein